MFVSRSMTRKVITVVKETTIVEARELMNQHEIRHLPVVDPENYLVGIITDRGVRSALPFNWDKVSTDPQERAKWSHLTVGEVMTPNPITILPTHTLQDALLLIQDKKMGAFPVVDTDGKLKGIISIRDLLRAFINVLGIGEPGTLLGILVEEKVGQMKKIVDVITEEKISFGSILTARYWEKNKRAVFPYLRTSNVTRVKKRLQELGFELLDPMKWYMDQLPREDK